jgi:hypothetical protein
VYNENYYLVEEIIAVCNSEEKGTKKKVVAECILEEDYGCIGNGRMNVHSCLEDSYGWEIGMPN